MERTRTTTALALMTCAALAIPAAASAQSFAERAREVRARADALRGEWEQRGAGREEQTERFTKTVHIGANGELDIGNMSGDIVVSRGGGDNATIEVLKTSRAATADEAKQTLQLVAVDISERPGRAEVRVRYPRNDGGGWNRRHTNVSVAFTITAPAGTQLTLKSMSGNVRVKDIKGELTAESMSGNIQIVNGGRVATTKSMSGDVDIADTQIEGALDAASMSGTVTLRKVKVRRLDAGSVSGNVVLADVDCERATVQSISGEVRYDGPLARNGRYEFKSHSGEVRVAIAGGSGFELDANTFSGNLRSDFPMQVEGNDQHSFMRRRAVHGTYGDGSAVLELNTFSGNIAITKK